VEGLEDGEVTDRVLALRAQHDVVGRAIAPPATDSEGALVAAPPPLVFAINHSFGAVTYDVGALRRLRGEAGYGLVHTHTPCQSFSTHATHPPRATSPAVVHRLARAVARVVL
jgi:hypothetical protein